ncbi:conjugal transfer protein TraN [Ursidibacter arcticus]
MMNFQRIIFWGLLIPSFATAQSSMKSNFDEGRAVGKSASGSASQINANDIAPNLGSPQEASLYTGQDANPQLNLMGTQALQSSEIGQLLTTSSVNNPADNISTESDMIKRSDEIVKNANYLTGGVGGKQCIKQTLSKSHFTHHYCEKDQQINKICKNTANVKWSGERKLVINEIKIPQSEMNVKFIRHQYFDAGGAKTGYHQFSIPITSDGIISGYTIRYFGVKTWGNKNRPVIFLNKKYIVPLNEQITERDINIPVKKGSYLNGRFKITGGLGSFSGISAIFRSAQMEITLFIKEEKDDLKAEIEWIDGCKDFDLENAISLGDKCTQKGETRNFSKDGKTVSIHSDCWEKQTEYLISDASDNECKKYDDNPNCTVGERECISSLNGLCNRFKVKYQCQHTTKTDGVVCGDKFFCSDGSCSDLEDSKNTNFGHAVSQLASLAQAGKDVSLDNQNLRAFTGRPMACRKSGFGFSDCCKDSGWGHKAGLAKCNSEENVLGKAKEKKVVIYVGTYCDKKVLKKCVRKKSSYCVFDNKLARIVQYQGRSGQLGIGFGGAKHPDCRGITVEELQRINFNAMDYSDFYEDLEKQKDMPNQDKIINYIKQNISSQMQQ